MAEQTDPKSDDVVIWEVRWQCAKCGRFLPEERVRSWDERDPDAYYGVRGVTVGDCDRCGQVDDPRCVQTKPMVLS